MSPARWRKMVDRGHSKLPTVPQCALLGVTRVINGLPLVRTYRSIAACPIWAPRAD